MKRKGQLDHPIIGFFILALGLILIGGIFMKMFISIKSPLVNSFGNITNGGATAVSGVNKVLNTAITFWDKVIVFAFLFGIIFVFISAFFIDVHPIFIVLYIFINFMFMIFAPQIMESLATLYDPLSGAYLGDEVYQNLPFTIWIAQNFGVFIVGLMIATGIIIYTKLSWNKGIGGRA